MHAANTEITGFHQVVRSQELTECPSQSFQLRSALWALWCRARSPAACTAQPREGGASATGWPPDVQEALPQEYWWWLTGWESLPQRKLSEATSCSRPTRIPFMAWMSLKLWKRRHYEAAHAKTFLSEPSSFPGGNRKHIMCSIGMKGDSQAGRDSTENSSGGNPRSAQKNRKCILIAISACVIRVSQKTLMITLNFYTFGDHLKSNLWHIVITILITNIVRFSHIVQNHVKKR